MWVPSYQFNSIMKKALIALAAAAAATSCFAQGSVQLFGVIDTGISYGTASPGSSLWQLTSGEWSGSRLGFRGREDLGGGLEAGFWLEAGFDSDNGVGKSTSENNVTKAGGDGIGFNRRSTVSLISSWGELRLGRDKNPLYDGFNDFDPFGGDTVGAAYMWQAGREMYNNTTAVKRVSNSIGYHLPKDLGGLYGRVMVAFGEQSSDVPASNIYKGDGDFAGIYAGYDNKGPFTAGASYGKTKYSYYVPKAKGGDLTNYQLGATYDFKVVKLWALYSHDTVGASVAHQELNGSGWSLGLTAPIGKGNLAASYSTYKWKNGYDQKGKPYYVGTPDGDKFSVGYFYSMSKRTWLYGALGTISMNDGLDTPLAGSKFNSGTLSGRSTGIDLGIRHSF